MPTAPPPPLPDARPPVLCVTTCSPPTTLRRRRRLRLRAIRSSPGNCSCEGNHLVAGFGSAVATRRGTSHCARQIKRRAMWLRENVAASREAGACASMCDNDTRPTASGVVIECQESMICEEDRTYRKMFGPYPPWGCAASTRRAMRCASPALSDSRQSRHGRLATAGSGGVASAATARLVKS